MSFDFEQEYIKLNDIDIATDRKIKLTTAIQSLEFTNGHIIVFVERREDFPTILNQCRDICSELGYEYHCIDNRFKLLNSQYSIIMESYCDKYINGMVNFTSVIM